MTAVRPWWVCWPLLIPRQARDELELNMAELGEEPFWDEIWRQRDAGQDALRVRAIGAWPWTAAKAAELQETAVAEKPARMKVVVGRPG